jgi:hypothetical protein
MSTKPAFVFTRRIDDEVEHDLLLSGILVLDLPAHERIDPDTTIPGSDDVVAVLLDHLLERARAGDIGPYEVVCGWRGEPHLPDHDAFRDDDEAREAWSRTRARIRIRMPRTASVAEH